MWLILSALRSPFAVLTAMPPSVPAVRLTELAVAYAQGDLRRPVTIFKAPPPSVLAARRAELAVAYAQGDLEPFQARIP